MARFASLAGHRSLLRGPTDGTAVAFASIVLRAHLILFFAGLAALPASAAPIVLREGDRLLTDAERLEWINVARCSCDSELTIALDLSSLAQTGNAALVAGKSCLTTENRISSSCRIVWDGTIDTETHTLKVTASELAGSCAATETKIDLTLFVDAEDEDVWTSATTMSIGVDTKPPSAPEKGDVVAGEGLAEVSFETDEKKAVQHQVLCTTLAGGAVLDDPPEAVFDSELERCGQGDGLLAARFVCAEASDGTASVTVLGLTDHVAYRFAMVSVDDAGNPSSVTTIGEATPSPEQDFWERYQQGGGDADGTGCQTASPGILWGLLFFVRRK